MGAALHLLLPLILVLWCDVRSNGRRLRSCGRWRLPARPPSAKVNRAQLSLCSLTLQGAHRVDCSRVARQAASFAEQEARGRQGGRRGQPACIRSACCVQLGFFLSVSLQTSKQGGSLELVDMSTRTAACNCCCCQASVSPATHRVRLTRLPSHEWAVSLPCRPSVEQVPAGGGGGVSRD